LDVKILFFFNIDFILPVQISIQNPIPPCAKLAFHQELIVGILIMPATGTKLNTITLISASQYWQKSLKDSQAINFSSTII
jgi:hypothetical protein